MSIVCISDTHGHHRECDPLPAGDVLVHAGDFTRYGRIEDLIDFKAWVDEVAARFQYVLLVDGNHEINAPWRCFAKQLLEAADGGALAQALSVCVDELDEVDPASQTPDLLEFLRATAGEGDAPHIASMGYRTNPKIRFLANELAEIRVDLATQSGERMLRVFGTEFYWPVTEGAGEPCARGMNPVLERALTLAGCLSDAACDVASRDNSIGSEPGQSLPLDVLIAHGPCWDRVDGGEGCPFMRSLVDTRLMPQVVVSGHVHDAHGVVEAENGILFVNATICGPGRESRKKGWEPIVVAI